MVILLIGVVVVFSLKLKETFANSTPSRYIIFSDTLENGQALIPGTTPGTTGAYLASCNKTTGTCKYVVRLDTNGTLEMARMTPESYNNKRGKTIVSNPNLETGYRMEIDENNNIYIINNSRVLWYSNTAGQGTGKAKLFLDSNGKLALIDEKKKVLWSWEYSKH